MIQQWEVDNLLCNCTSVIKEPTETTASALPQRSCYRQTTSDARITFQFFPVRGSGFYIEVLGIRPGRRDCVSIATPKSTLAQLSDDLLISQALLVERDYLRSV